MRVGERILPELWSVNIVWCTPPAELAASVFTETQTHKAKWWIYQYSSTIVNMYTQWREAGIKTTAEKGGLFQMDMVI